MSEQGVSRVNEYLAHMVQAIHRIEEYVEECSEVEFLNTPLLQDAVVRNIEVLGEAANQLMKRHPEFANSNSQVPWQAIYYMRNRIIHGYASIDYELVWAVIHKDLPELKGQLQSIQAANAEKH